MAPADVLVLGPVALAGKAGPVRVPPKQRRLLAALVVAEGRACGADELVDALWGGTPPPSARKLLRIYVSKLREQLPPGVAVETTAGGYALSLPDGALDAARFEQLLDECAAARRDGNLELASSLAAQALALRRGRAFGELADEGFVRAESTRLEELGLVALEESLEAQLGLGGHREVLGEALALAQENPFRERAHELVMLALYRCRRQSEALDHFMAVRTRLNEDLGLEPGPALQELQRRILQHDPSLDLPADVAQAVSVLPLPPTPLIGRERELGELATLLARRDARLIVLAGAGGSGKTRLALEAARQAAGTFANGARLVELAPLRNPALVIPTIAHALGIAADPDEEPLDALATALAPQELLLLVDNAEHVREAAAAFAELVAGAPRLTLLVTSRAVLHVSGEHVFPVAPLAEGDAVELFVQRARLLEPTFERTSENEVDIREVCRRVDCLPLAIELAAARSRTLTPQALRERLDARLALLTGGPRDLPSRQQTLRETVAWSFDLLDEHQQRALARLAVFPGGATLAAAEAVCKCDPDTLGVLVDDHLVVRDHAPDEPRFALLETIREFALDVLGDDRAAVERELRAHFADLVDRAVLRGPGMEEWLLRLDGDVDNLRAALDAAGDAEVELRLAGGLWRYWLIRGLLAEGFERIERALMRTDETATYARARALGGAATLAVARGDVARAKELAKRAIGAARRVGAPLLESMGHRVLGVIAEREREFATARRHIERCIAILEREGREPALEKLNLGVVAFESGEFAEAIELFEVVLDDWRRRGITEGVGFAVLNRGLVRLELGEIDPARRDFEEALRCFQELGYRVQVAASLQGLAATEVAAGHHVEAAQLLARAAALRSGAGRLADTLVTELARKAEDAARSALGDAAFEAAYAAGLDPGG